MHFEFHERNVQKLHIDHGTVRMDELSLIEAVHFLAYISVEAPLGALPRGTASRPSHRRWVTQA